MKNVLVIMGLTALLLASGAKAQDITISWQVTGKKITGCYPSVVTGVLRRHPIQTKRDRDP